MGYELHPETPREGVPLGRLIPGLDPDAMVKSLERSGSPYGVRFNKISIVSNSRLALEASEFARDCGKFDLMHSLFFEAYFLEGKNIGDLRTVLEVSARAGLDVGLLEEALETGRYSERLAEARRLAGRYGVTGLPTYIINGSIKIVGAQPYKTFSSALRNALKQ